MFCPSSDPLFGAEGFGDNRLDFGKSAAANARTTKDACTQLDIAEAGSPDLRLIL